MNRLFGTLNHFGFVPFQKGMKWHRGSAYGWGESITVFELEGGIKIKYHSWEYDLFGDMDKEEFIDYWRDDVDEALTIIQGLKNGTIRA